MNRREAIEKLIDELFQESVNHEAWRWSGGKDLQTSFHKGFTACLDLLWPCMEAVDKKIYCGCDTTPIPGVRHSDLCSKCNALAALDERIKEGK